LSETSKTVQIIATSALDLKKAAKSGIKKYITAKNKQKPNPLSVVFTHETKKIPGFATEDLNL